MNARTAPPLGDYSPSMTLLESSNAAAAALAISGARFLCHRYGVSMDSPLMAELEALRASIKRVGVGPTFDLFPILRGTE